MSFGKCWETERKSTVLVKHHVKQLKLPTMHSECEKTALRATKENLDHLAYLLALCELELVGGERRAAERRLKAARLPATPRAAVARRRAAIGRAVRRTLQSRPLAQCHRLRHAGRQARRPRSGDLRRARSQVGRRERTPGTTATTHRQRHGTESVRHRRG
jgi:hypothetical protein